MARQRCPARGAAVLTSVACVAISADPPADCGAVSDHSADVRSAGQISGRSTPAICACMPRSEKCMTPADSVSGARLLPSPVSLAVPRHELDGVSQPRNRVGDVQRQDILAFHQLLRELTLDALALRIVPQPARAEPRCRLRTTRREGKGHHEPQPEPLRRAGDVPVEALVWVDLSASGYLRFHLSPCSRYGAGRSGLRDAKAEGLAW